MSQWARTLEGGDMLLPTSGSGAAALVTSPAECTRIKIKSVLQFVLGEWFLDTNQGFPWQSVWSQKAPNVDVLRQLFRKAILDVPLVASVADLSLTYDRPTRNLRYSLTVRLTTGETVSLP